jgi:hypothetical protein
MLQTPDLLLPTSPPITNDAPPQAAPPRLAPH